MIIVAVYVQYSTYLVKDNPRWIIRQSFTVRVVKTCVKVIHCLSCGLHEAVMVAVIYVCRLSDV